MPRTPNPFARPYNVTPEAKAQRKQAAIERWLALEGESRTLPGRPRKRKPPSRDAITGRFLRVSK